MAVQTLDELLSQLSADEKKLFESTLEKHKALKDGWLRQDDYSREMNKLKGQQTEYEKAKSRNEELEAWAERNVPIWNSLAEKGILDKETGEELWSKQKQTLEDQLKEANAKVLAGGADMDPAELERRVKDIVTQAGGGLTRAEVAAIVNDETKKLAAEQFQTEWKAKETDFNTKTIPFIWGGGANVAILANHYEQESGEKWTAEKSEELFKLMSQEQIFDALKVEEKFMAPVREKKKGSEIERIRQENEDLKKQLANRSMPGGGGEDYIPQPGEPKGALREMLERSAADGDFESLIRNKAAEAGKALVLEGKS